MAFEIEDARCVHQTEEAILVEAPDFGDEQVWIPQSQVTEDSEVYAIRTEGTLVVSDWFAEKRGWV